MTTVVETTVVMYASPYLHKYFTKVKSQCLLAVSAGGGEHKHSLIFHLPVPVNDYWHITTFIEPHAYRLLIPKNRGFSGDYS